MGDCSDKIVCDLLEVLKHGYVTIIQEGALRARIQGRVSGLRTATVRGLRWVYSPTPQLALEAIREGKGATIGSMVLKADSGETFRCGAGCVCG